MKATGMMILMWIIGLISLGLILSVAYAGAIIIVPLFIGGLLYFSYKFEYNRK